MEAYGTKTALLCRHWCRNIMHGPLGCHAESLAHRFVTFKNDFYSQYTVHSSHIRDNSCKIFASDHSVMKLSVTAPLGFYAQGDGMI